MAHGVFGAAGYRASLGDDDQNDGRGDRHDDRQDDRHDDQVERADQMVGESGIVYGAEPIPREMIGGVRQEKQGDDAVRNGQPFGYRVGRGTGVPGSRSDGTHISDFGHGESGHGESSHSDRAHSPESGSVPVGRLGGSDLYITPRLTFDLVPAQPLLSPEERHHPAENEPEPIRRLLAMYRFTRPADRAREFVRQARAMEKYEPEGTFDSSFQAFSPVYSDMTVRQLKGYFAWRTCVRHGQYPPTSTSTVFVYIYELLNGVGVKDATEAYRKLKELKDRYADRLDAVVARYASDWLRDLVIAGNLKGDPVTEQFSRGIDADRTYAVLSRPQDDKDSLIARAARGLGSYKTSKSPLNRQVTVPQEDGDGTMTLFDLALACVWKALLSSHVAAKGYFRSRVAAWKVTPVTLFRRAVYFDRDLADHPYEARRVAIDAVREYTRENGHWYLGRYEAVDGQKAFMNALLHETDRIGRLVWHTGRPLKPRGFYPPYTKVVEETLVGLKHRLDRQEWEAAHPPVHVDLGRLTAIRQAAAGTRESLLTQEERDAEAEEARREAQEQQQKQRTQESVKSSQSTATSGAVPSLSPDELFLLRALADGRPASAWKPTLLTHHVLPSVLADSINSKLFDLVGDSVLETDENGDPVLIEDYLPDVRDFLTG